MKIAYCIAGTRHSGGMERVLANKANWLVAHGHEVIIITTDQHGEPSYFEMDPRIRHFDLGINYEDNNGKSFFHKLCCYPFKQLRHRRRLAALLKQLRPDITVSMFCNDAGIVPSINDGSAKVLEIHFSRFKRTQYGRKGLWRLADRLRSHTDIKTVRKYKKFIVLTEEDRGYWGNLPNMGVIPNACNLPLSHEYNIGSGKVIAVGRFSYQKGFDRLVKAWKQVAEIHAGWSLHIYGNGEKDDISQMINTLNISHCVHLHDATADIINRYKESSFLVMTSRYEGFPMVMIEAQSCGLPVVSFDCKCGPKDIITHGVNGLLVKEGDINRLSSAISWMMDNPELRLAMSNAAIEKMVDYDETTIMKRWVELFNSIR